MAVAPLLHVAADVGRYTRNPKNVDVATEFDSRGACRDARRREAKWQLRKAEGGQAHRWVGSEGMLRQTC